MRTGKSGRRVAEITAVVLLRLLQYDRPINRTALSEELGETLGRVETAMDGLEAAGWVLKREGQRGPVSCTGHPQLGPQGAIQGGAPLEGEDAATFLERHLNDRQRTSPLTPLEESVQTLLLEVRRLRTPDGEAC